MGKFSRDKGARIERGLVKLHTEAGIPCERVPLSGAAGGSFKGDLRIGNNKNIEAEVKGRANGAGFVTIEKWLGDNHLLFLHRDRTTPLVVMPWAIYERLMREHVDNE